MRLWKLITTGLEWKDLGGLVVEWWPLGVTVMTAAAGYFQAVPIMWIIMATVLATMGAVVIGLSVMLQMERMNPANKLQWITVFNCDLTPVASPATGNRRARLAQKAQGLPMLSPTQLNPSVSRTIDIGQLGVEFTNTAHFPISVIFVRAITDVEGEEPPRSVYPKPAHTINPGAKVRFCDDKIDMDKHPCGRMIGNMNLLFKYGRIGKENIDLKIEAKINIVMEHFGFVAQIVNDYTAKAS